jgi:hypothetical protein
VCSSFVKTSTAVIDHLTPPSPFSLVTERFMGINSLFCLRQIWETQNLKPNAATLTSSQPCSAYDLFRGLLSLFAHQTSASVLASSKPASHALSEPSSTSSIKKRKKTDDTLIATETDPDSGSRRSTKKPNLRSHGGSDVRSTPVVELKSEGKNKTKGDTNLTSETVKAKDTPKENKRKDKKGKKKPAAEPAVFEGEDGGDEPAETSKRDHSSPQEDEYIPPTHEFLAGASRPNSTPSLKKSKKHVPPDESPEQRDSRTVFVGNVPFQVMTTKVG